MFAKLLKHEWNASAGLLGILSAAALAGGLLGGLSLRFFLTAASGQEMDTGVQMLAIPLMFLLVIAMLGLVAYIFAVQIILVSRFYRSRFTDEGYLTFTLPVTGTQSYLSALVNILIWNAISMLVMLLSMGVLLLIGSAGTKLPMAVFESLIDANATVVGYETYGILSVILSVVSFVSQPVIILTCVTLGAVMARKHKILAAFGSYYILSMAIGMITSFATTFAMIAETEADGSPYSGAMQLMVGMQILVQIGLAVGGSALSIWLTNKKLNLP